MQQYRVGPLAGHRSVQLLALTMRKEVESEGPAEFGGRLWIVEAHHRAARPRRNGFVLSAKAVTDELLVAVVNFEVFTPSTSDAALLERVDDEPGNDWEITGPLNVISEGVRTERHRDAVPHLGQN